MSSIQDSGRLLLEGEISEASLTLWGSNYTFLVNVNNGGQGCQAVYKPRDGEAPLWDFPSGTLYKREYCAYLLSQILGWELVPLTVIRDGPYGVGSLQLFVEHDPQVHYYSLRDDHSEELKRIACFDLISNNADRKGIHCIQGADGHIWGIDHGLTFHAHLKVRTVIWDFAGEPIPEELLDDLETFGAKLGEPDGAAKELVEQLHPTEFDALKQRIEWITAAREFPGTTRRRA